MAEELNVNKQNINEVRKLIIGDDINEINQHLSELRERMTIAENALETLKQQLEDNSEHMIEIITDDPTGSLLDG